MARPVTQRYRLELVALGGAGGGVIVGQAVVGDDGSRRAGVLNRSARDDMSEQLRGLQKGARAVSGRDIVAVDIDELNGVVGGERGRGVSISGVVDLGGAKFAILRPIRRCAIACSATVVNDEQIVSLRVRYLVDRPSPQRSRRSSRFRGRDCGGWYRN